jgi:O-antigen/teichoic acid export membrane protein
VKGIALAVVLAATPASLAYLGAERFGLWMTAAAAAGFFGLANLGLDKGLLNGLAAAHGRAERTRTRHLVSTGFALVAALALALLVLFALAYPLLPWPTLLGSAGSAAGAEAGPVMAVLVAVSLLGLLAGLVDTVQTAQQESYLNSAWEALGKLASLAALLAAIHAGAGLPWLVLAFAGTPLLASAANGWVLFRRRRPELRPSLSAVNGGEARRLVRTGGYFFLIQLGLTVAYYADNLVVAPLFGGEAVATYAVVARLFDLPGMLVLLIAGPFWPAHAEAIAAGETGWVARSLARALAASIATALVTVLPLVAWGPSVLRLWIGSDLAAPPGLFIAFGAFWLVSAVTQPLGVFFNAAGALRYQLAVAFALAAVGLGCKIAAAEIWGLEGVAWGRAAAEILCAAVPGALYAPRLLRRLSSAERAC